MPKKKVEKDLREKRVFEVVYSIPESDVRITIAADSLKSAQRSFIDYKYEIEEKLHENLPEWKFTGIEEKGAALPVILTPSKVAQLDLCFVVDDGDLVDPYDFSYENDPKKIIEFKRLLQEIDKWSPEYRIKLRDYLK
jgi:hypothetical protein